MQHAHRRQRCRTSPCAQNIARCHAYLQQRMPHVPMRHRYSTHQQLQIPEALTLWLTRAITRATPTDMSSSAWPQQIARGKQRTQWCGNSCGGANWRVVQAHGSSILSNRHLQETKHTSRHHHSRDLSGTRPCMHFVRACLRNEQTFCLSSTPF